MYVMYVSVHLDIDAQASSSPDNITCQKSKARHYKLLRFICIVGTNTKLPGKAIKQLQNNCKLFSHIHFWVLQDTKQRKLEGN